MKEIESLQALEAHLDQTGKLCGVVIQGLDLREHTARICSVKTTNTVFLGCQLTEPAQAYVTADGAMVFPVMAQGRPYKVHRSGLYTLAELMEGYVRGDHDSFQRDAQDSKIYRHFKAAHDNPAETSIMEAMAQRLHDHSIDDALNDLLHDPDHPRNVVAIMGGHAMKRDEAVFADVARMARALTRKGYYIATGGGPGAMEAGNLGAWFAPFEDAALDEAIAHMSQIPSYKLGGYLELGYDMLDKYPGGGESLAIPTWFYGHEPTNQFATHIAKYFSNSLREDGLLAIATHGVIYAPGSAGTIQEVFMDAAQNHYGTFTKVSPMVFYGHEYWTKKKPVYELVRVLSQGKQYGDMLGISDDVQAIVDFIVDHPPIDYTG